MVELIQVTIHATDFGVSVQIHIVTTQSFQVKKDGTIL